MAPPPSTKGKAPASDDGNASDENVRRRDELEASVDEAENDLMCAPEDAGEGVDLLLFDASRDDDALGSDYQKDLKELWKADSRPYSGVTKPSEIAGKSSSQHPREERRKNHSNIADADATARGSPKEAEEADKDSSQAQQTLQSRVRAPRLRMLENLSQRRQKRTQDDPSVNEEIQSLCLPVVDVSRKGNGEGTSDDGQIKAEEEADESKGDASDDIDLPVMSATESSFRGSRVMDKMRRFPSIQRGRGTAHGGIRSVWNKLNPKDLIVSPVSKNLGELTGSAMAAPEAGAAIKSENPNDNSFRSRSQEQVSSGQRSTLPSITQNTPGNKGDAGVELNASGSDDEASRGSEDASKRVQRMMLDRVMSSFMDWLDVKLKVKEEEEVEEQDEEEVKEVAVGIEEEEEQQHLHDHSIRRRYKKSPAARNHDMAIKPAHDAQASGDPTGRPVFGNVASPAKARLSNTLQPDASSAKRKKKRLMATAPPAPAPAPAPLPAAAPSATFRSGAPPLANAFLSSPFSGPPPALRPFMEMPQPPAALHSAVGRRRSLSGAAVAPVAVVASPGAGASGTSPGRSTRRLRMTSGDRAEGKSTKRVRPNDRRQEEEDDGEEDEDENRPPRAKLPKVQEDEVSGAKLACPFFKHNPRKHKNQRPCCGPGWDHVHRIKEHIYRKHSLPKFSCPRCSQPFETQSDLQAHARSPDPCEVREPEVLDGITLDQEKKLRSRKKTTAKELTEAEKWTQVYSILFPDVRGREIPSPYYNTEDAKTNLGGYEDYLRRELPPLVRRQLEREVERELSFVEEGMKQKVIDIARNLQLTLFRGYQQLENQERGVGDSSPRAGEASSSETGGSSFAATTDTSPSTMTTNGTTPEVPDPLEIFSDHTIPDFDFGFLSEIPYPGSQEPSKEPELGFGLPQVYGQPEPPTIQPGMELLGGQQLDLPYYGMEGYDDGHGRARENVLSYAP